MAVHHLAERGLLDLDAPIAEHWPEYGRAGKESATPRHALTHSTGAPLSTWHVVGDAWIMHDWDRSVRAAAAATAKRRAGVVLGLPHPQPGLHPRRTPPARHRHAARGVSQGTDARSRRAAPHLARTAAGPVGLAGRPEAVEGAGTQDRLPRPPESGALRRERRSHRADPGRDGALHGAGHGAVLPAPAGRRQHRRRHRVQAGNRAVRPETRAVSKQPASIATRSSATPSAGPTDSNSAGAPSPPSRPPSPSASRRGRRSSATTAATTATPGPTPSTDSYSPI